MMITESRNPRTMHIDTLSTYEMLRLINEEDQTVPLAVEKQLHQISRAVEVIAEAFIQGAG